MRNERPAFLSFLLGNLRLSALVCAVAVAGLFVYSLAVEEPIMWDIIAFLATGMFLSSLINAWADARRSRRSSG